MVLKDNWLVWIFWQQRSIRVLFFQTTWTTMNNWNNFFFNKSCSCCLTTEYPTIQTTNYANYTNWHPRSFFKQLKQQWTTETTSFFNNSCTCCSMLYMLFGNQVRMPSDISDDSVVAKDERRCPFNLRAIASLSYYYLLAVVDVDAGGGRHVRVNSLAR